MENAQTAVNLDSHNACYIEHLGKIYAINRQYDIALKYIQTALEIEPSNTSMLITYAGILIENDMFIEAEKALIDASRKTNNPEHKSNILNNLLILQFQYGNYDKAKDTIDMMERVSYKNKKLMTFKSMLSLIKKDFKNGWIYHENRDVRRPAWCIEKQEYNNEPNARVFVSAEQGIGDEIMFSSVLPDLIKRNKSVILECDERLSDIYKRSFGEKVRVINATQILHDNEYDYAIRLGSLPRLYRNNLESFKRSSSGVLRCNEEQAKVYRNQIKALYDKPIIGISWKSELKRRLNRGNSMELRKLLESLTKIDAVYINLQYGDVEDEIKEATKGLNIDLLFDSSIDYKNDIDKLASLIKACDYVVTTPNVTVSLAGSLGVKTLFMMPKAGDRWRWGINDEKSYWFDNVSIFRQKGLNDWQSAIDSVIQRLLVG